MRTGMMALVAAAAIAVHALPVVAADAPLRYKQTTPGEAPALAGALSYVSPLQRKPYALKELPAGLSPKVTYFSVTVGRRNHLALVDTGKEPRLFFDVDADASLTDEAALPGPPADMAEAPEGMNVYSFGPVQIEDGPALAFQVISSGSFNYMMYGPAGLREGIVHVGDRELLVQIVDGNLDGRYDGFYSPRGRGNDWLAIDMDGDGSISAGDSLTAEFGKLTRLLRVGEGYHEVRVEPDGSSIALTPYGGALGTVATTDPAGALILESGRGVFALSDKGEWQVPVGRYGVTGSYLSAVDEAGDRWTLVASSPRPTSLAVKEDEPATVKLGQPLKLQTAARRTSPAAASIDLALRGQGGEGYRPGALKNGKPMLPPRFRILNEQGKELAAGQFEYG